MCKSKVLLACIFCSDYHYLQAVVVGAKEHLLEKAMAQRRMFSKEITNSSEFQMMSPSAQALYFHIGMNSDDDGFCEVFTIVRMTESKPDDLRALHERGLVYLIDSKVGIVKDWHTNNDIRSDRYTRSKYMSDPKYGDVYKTIMQEKIVSLSKYNDISCNTTGITSCNTTGITQGRVGKGSIDTEGVKLPDVPFSSKEYIENMKLDKKPHIRLIGSYFLNRNLFFPNKRAAEVAIRRHLKAATQVVNFEQSKVSEAFEKCKQYEDRGIAWTLDTVLKELTK